MEWSSLNAKQKSYVAHHRATLVGFFLAGSGEIEGKEENAGLRNSPSRYELTSPEDVPLEAVISHIFSSTSPKERIHGVSGVMLLLLEPPKMCSPTGREVKLKRKSL